MKLEKKALIKENFESIVMKITALLAFIAINFISYSAFSAEIALKTDLETHIESASVFEKDDVVSTAGKIESIPTCQLAPEGYVKNKWKSVRIQIQGAVVAGAETLSDLGHQLKKLATDHKCSPLPVACSLATEGVAMGAWVKHRILVQDMIAFGGDTTGRLFDQLSMLKNIGVCE